MNEEQIVAQICNLLYRRIAFGKARFFSRRQKIERPADCKSAIQQSATLRYKDGALNPTL
jgi:hypothetical protein